MNSIACVGKVSENRIQLSHWKCCYNYLIVFIALLQCCFQYSLKNGDDLFEWWLGRRWPDGCIQGGVHHPAVHLGERCRHPRQSGPSYTPSERALRNVLVERAVWRCARPHVGSPHRVVPVVNPTTRNSSTLPWNSVTATLPWHSMALSRSPSIPMRLGHCHTPVVLGTATPMAHVFQAAVALDAGVTSMILRWVWEEKTKY